MVYIAMAEKKNELDKIDSDLSDIQKTLDKTTTAVQQIGAAIANSKSHPNTGASAAEFDGQLTQMLQELHEIKSEHKKILAELNEILENTNDERIVQSLKDKLHYYGCSLLLGCDANNRKLYRFAFDDEHCIVVAMNDLRLELVHMNPLTPSFAIVKKYFDETQDLNELLATFGSVYGNIDD